MSTLPSPARPKPFRGLLLMTVLASWLTGTVALAGTESLLPEGEREAIELLITAVEQTDATFVRNGAAYGAASAGKFLRRKWQARAAEIGSAEQFIDQVASSSSTTGQPYLIRFADGRETPSAAFLRERLAEHRRALR